MVINYIWKCQVPITIKCKQPACNSTVCEFPSLHLCLLQSVKAFSEGFMNFCSYLQQSIMPFWRPWPILTSNCAGFQRNLHLQINKVDWKICSLLLSAALPNAAVPTNSEDRWWLLCIHRLCWYGSITSGIRYNKQQVWPGNAAVSGW